MPEKDEKVFQEESKATEKRSGKEPEGPPEVGQMSFLDLPGQDIIEDNIVKYLPDRSSVEIVKDKKTGQDTKVPIHFFNALTSTCQFFYNQYQQKRIQHITERLVLFTAQGKEKQVEKLFNISPANIRYLIEKADVKDYSGREFKGISAFQYALWARDWHMWEMMLDALDEAERHAITEEEWEKLPENEKGKIGIITKKEINAIRKELLEQYKQVVNNGLDYMIERYYWEGDQRIPYLVKVEGETHFDLEGPKFCLMPEEADFKPEKGKFYVRIAENTLHYKVVNLLGVPVTGSIPLASLHCPLAQLDSVDNLKPYIPAILEITARNAHTHPQTLISSLTTYYEQFDNWDWEQCKRYWCRVVGGAEREIVANIGQNFCRLDVKLNSRRTFREPHFPRTLKFFNLSAPGGGRSEAWFPLGEDNMLGIGFGIWAGKLACPGVTGAAKFRAPIISSALSALCGVRGMQITELAARLCSASSQEPDVDENHGIGCN